MADTERTHLKPKEVAESIGVSTTTVLGWISDGKLRASNVGAGEKRARWIVAKEDLQALLDSRSNQPKKAQSKKKRPKIRAYV